MNVFDLLATSQDSVEDEDEELLKKAKIWLKEAGFPQYVQMFNDGELPISLKSVQEDHSEFDGGSLMALFRRIEILNKFGQNSAVNSVQKSLNSKSKAQPISFAIANNSNNNNCNNINLLLGSSSTLPNNLIHRNSTSNSNTKFINNNSSPQSIYLTTKRKPCIQYIEDDDDNEIEVNNTYPTPSQDPPIDQILLPTQPIIDDHTQLTNSTLELPTVHPNDQSKEEKDQDTDSEDLDDEDDKENFLEQFALSSRWSYEPKSRRWSHIEPPAKSNCNSTYDILTQYLGKVTPQPYIPDNGDLSNHIHSIPEESCTDNPMRKYLPDFKFVNSRRLDSESTSATPINEESKTDPTTTTTSSSSSRSTPIASDKSKSNHILRSTSLKLFKAVSRLNPSHFSLKSSRKDKVSDENDINEPDPVTLEQFSPSEVSKSLPEPIKRPPKSHYNTLPPMIIPNSNNHPQFHSHLQSTSINNHDSFSLGDAGWFNIRTGSFISRQPVSKLVDSDPSIPQNKIQPQPQSQHQHHHNHPTITRTSVDDLDPLLNLLESDVKSLDVMRSKIKSKTPPGKARPKSCQLNPSALSSSVEDQLDTEDDNRTMIDLHNLNKYPDKHQSLIAPSLPSYTSSSDTPSSDTNTKLAEFNDNNTLSHLIPFNRHAASRWSHTAVHTKSMSVQRYAIHQLPVIRINLLRKLAVLCYTSIIEKCCPPQRNLFSWRLPRLLIQKDKDYTSTNSQSGGANQRVVFGVNLSVLQSRFGKPYPPAINHLFDYLRQHGPTTQGIFRKTGMKSRIKQLILGIEQNYDYSDFEDYNINDIADVLKTFFRDLPERIFTNKLSATLLAIYTYVPKESQYEGLQWVLLSLPDENRIALVQLLEFLAFISKYFKETKMDVKNLSLCLAPSLFSFQNDGLNNNSPLRSSKKSNGPNQKLLAEQNAAHLCLVDMITHVSSIFQVNEDMMKKTASVSDSIGVLAEFTSLINNPVEWHDWIQYQLLRLNYDYGSNDLMLLTTMSSSSSSSSPPILNDSKDRGWIHLSREMLRRVHSCVAAVSPNNNSQAILNDVSVSYRKLGNINKTNNNNIYNKHNKNSESIAIRTWKASVDINIPPGFLFIDIKDRRSQWDPMISQIETVQSLNEYSELQRQLMPNPDGSGVMRECRILRAHQLGVHGSRHILLGESVMVDEDLVLDWVPTGKSLSRCHEGLTSQQRVPWVTAQVLRDDFVVEAINSCTSRVVWISRVDLLGHHSDWYNSHWGHIMAQRLASLKHFAESSLPTSFLRGSSGTVVTGNSSELLDKINTSSSGSISDDKLSLDLLHHNNPDRETQI